MNSLKSTLSIIEKDETKGWEPVVLARKMVKIVKLQKSPTKIYHSILRTEAGSGVEVYPSREIVQDDHSRTTIR